MLRVFRLEGWRSHLRLGEVVMTSRNPKQDKSVKRSSTWAPAELKNYFSSRTIAIAFIGHSLAQMPQPLQKSRSISSSSFTAASGQ